jgi:hypothetical protein
VKAGEAGEELFESDFCFHAGQLGAEAVVDAGAKGDMAALMAAEIELVGAFKAALIAVGEGEAGEEHLAAADRVAIKIGVGAWVARLGFAEIVIVKKKNCGGRFLGIERQGLPLSSGAK